MKRRHSQTGFNLFFIEFIIVLFFFLLISTICIRVFVYAHRLTQNAEAVSHAQAVSSSLAEAIEGTDGSAEALLTFYPNATFSGTALLLTYSRDFTECKPEEAFYTCTVNLNLSDRRKEASIMVTDRNQNLIYELPVSFYRPLTRKEALS